MFPDSHLISHACPVHWRWRISQERERPMDHPSEPTPELAGSFPIVGIGASAGGLEAFKELLSYVEEGTSLAYVFVQHLAPSHESLLPELLSHATKMPVRLVTDQMAVEPDQVYVIPPNVTMTLSHGIFRLAARTPSAQPHLCIDAFFSPWQSSGRARRLACCSQGPALMAPW